MICACSRLDTGCAVPTRALFSSGHNGRVRGLLVAALVAGELVPFDGTPTDPWLVAETLGLTAVVTQFLAKSRATAAVRADRAAAEAAAASRRDCDLSYAREIRARRIADRAATRAAAEAARDRLIEAARRQRDLDWPGESWRDLPLA